MVVSSETPFQSLTASCQRLGEALSMALRHLLSSCSSSQSALASRILWSFSAATPRCSIMVASPPSSTIRWGPLPPPKLRARSVHHQYSARVSPFQANTGMPAAAMAAAAWSLVEKILQEHQRTSAPRAVRVSISTAVWVVMCREPITRAPLRGFLAANFSRMDIRPGISFSAISISRRPQAARLISLTL